MHHRSLRTVLIIAFLVNLSWGYTFTFLPSLVERLYQIPFTDDLHLYLSMSRGAAFFVLAIVSLLAFLRPKRFGVLTIVLFLAYVCFLLMDVILLAQSRMSFSVLLPEMTYFALIGAGIVRWFPGEDMVHVDSTLAKDGA
ncbi:MAG: hypothetical protein WCG83_07465 [Candidatus Peregrinibacteria bacterium]